MTDLIEFLWARLDEDERAARLALGRPVDPLSVRNPMLVVQLQDAHVRPLEEDYGNLFGSTLRAVPSAGHFVLESKDARVIYDPERMVREVEAKRAILDDYERDYWPDPGSDDELQGAHGAVSPAWVIRHLASIYSDHPDYDQSWGLP